MVLSAASIRSHHIEAGARRGFTLTELAIVLGIIGTILGAIWSASATVSANNKTQKASGQVLQIVNSYRTLYAQHGVDTADWTDVTCLGVNNGFFPSDMLQTGVACATGNTTTYPSNPWGAAAGGQYVAVWTYQSTPGIIVAYINLTQAACNNFANAVTMAPDAIWEDISGTGQWVNGVNGGAAPYTTAQINSYCAAGNGNSVYVMYKAK